MCGIIGIASDKPVSINIINSLKKLENQKIISLKNDVLKVDKKHMIKLNSIINFLINP